MKKKLILISLTVLCLNYSAVAQDDIQPRGFYLDALRFAQTQQGGSARIQAIGGTQVALGGDLSSALSNPAGLGFYNRSEVSITPALRFMDSRSTYLDEIADDSKTNFNIAQAGIAMYSEPESSGGSFKGGTFAITLTRINDFNNNYYIRGINDNTSMIDAFIGQANGANTNQFGGNDVLSLAYFNYLIGPESILTPPGPDNVYFTDVTGIPFQEERILTRGKQNRWSISYGANFNDKFYIGGGIGILTLDYRSERIYSESFDVDPLSGFTLSENLAINGTGVNATLGIIVRPVPSVRIGASFVSPSVYSLEDTYDATMTADWNDFLYEDAIDGDIVLNTEDAETDILVSNYNLTTPLKLSGGAAFFFGKDGFISADVDYIDYTGTKLSTDEFVMRDDNTAIDNLANTAAINYRIGGEYRINIYRFRAGYAYYDTAFDSKDVFYANSQSFSAGAGMRFQNIYVDMGIVHTISDTQYAPYFIQNGEIPVADIAVNNTRVMFTIGYNY